MAAASDRHAARLVFQSASVLISLPNIFMAACLQIPAPRRADHMFACVAVTWLVGAVVLPRDRRRL
jgi:hypothetical protein